MTFVTPRVTVQGPSAELRVSEFRDGIDCRLVYLVVE